MIVNKDGYIFIESTQKEEAIKIFNVITSLGILDNVKLFAVREQDISFANYDRKQLEITSQQWNSETIRAPLFDRFHSRDHYLGYQVREIAQNKLISIINNAFKIKMNEKLSENLRLFAEARAHLYNSEYAQSFIMAWSIIERTYSELWRQKLDKKDLESERFSKLTNTSQWSLDYVIEVLNLNGEIDDQEYDFIMELKRKRNKLYHSGKVISLEDAQRCVDFVTRILQDKMRFTS